MTTLFEALTVRPDVERAELLLTALSPISHHDAAEQDDSNTMLFNRQKQLLPLRAVAGMVSSESVAAVCAREPAPESVAALLRESATFPEFVAVCVVRRFIDIYNSYDGVGLFEGMTRYERLEARLRHAAVQARGLAAFWNRLCRDMQVPPHPTSEDEGLLPLLAVPGAIQQAALRALADQYRSILALARYWHNVRKQQSPGYAAKRGEEAAVAEESVTLEYAATPGATGGEEARVVEVPAITANSVRSLCVRQPSWRHLCRMLEIEEGIPGRGEVPPGIEAIFWNGGNIRSGAKQPSNPFGLAVDIRRNYPSLDLLGGVTDSFDLGEGRLKVGCWLVCRENRDALGGSPAADLAEATVSAFDLLDDVTLTRQATLAGLGQMIFNQQVLVPGTRVLVRMALTPGTRAETAGALYAALDEYLGDIPNVGGGSARGFGFVSGEWLESPERAERQDAYERYLRQNLSTLRRGLTSGDLGTGRVCCE